MGFSDFVERAANATLKHHALLEGRNPIQETNKQSIDYINANVISMGITIGHGLLYAIENSIITKLESEKYWAIILVAADRHLGESSESKQRLREILRNEIQDPLTRVAFDRSSAVPSDSVLHEGFAGRWPETEGSKGD